MSSAAVFDEYETTQDAPPACLCPWRENPYRLVSLWDIMTAFAGSGLFWSGYAFETMITDCLMKCGPGAVEFPIELRHAPVDPKTNEDAIKRLGIINDTFRRVGMPVSITETIDELRDKLSSSKATYEDLRTQLWALFKLCQKELGAKIFLYITPERLRFWPRQDAMYALGEDTHRAFPSTDFDASEAGVCLALSRATASVFHLMRVMEIGLTVMGAQFGLSPEHTNWGSAIEQIESRVRDMHKDPRWKALPDCKDLQRFYSEAASHFAIVKDAWRNHTAHARAMYTEEKATLIFENVAAFMQTLATRLQE